MAICAPFPRTARPAYNTPVMSLRFLDNVPAFRDLAAALQKGERGLSVTGLTDPAKALFLTSLVRASGRRVVYVQTAARPLELVDRECRFFFKQTGLAPRVLMFPPLADDPYQDVPPPLESVAARMRVLYSLTFNPPGLILTSLPAFLKPVPALDDLARLFFEVEKDARFGRDRLLDGLAEFGYAQEELVSSAGEFAWRGGIVDVFSPWQEAPWRIEFSGDDVASIREFDPSTQRSLKRIDRVVIPSLREYSAGAPFRTAWEEKARPLGRGAARDIDAKLELLRRNDPPPSFAHLALLLDERFVPLDRYLDDVLFVVDEPDEVVGEWEKIQEGWEATRSELEKAKAFHLPVARLQAAGLAERVLGEALALRGLGAEPGSRGRAFDLPFQSVPRFENRIPFFLEYLKKKQEERERCFIFLGAEGVRRKLSVLLETSGLARIESDTAEVATPRSETVLCVGALERGFAFPPERIEFFSEKEILTEERVIVSRPPLRPFLTQFQDLREGDTVVHTDYGVGLFKGLVKMEVEGTAREFMELVYRDGDQLFVPVEDLNLVQKFSGADAAAPPPLDKLGSPAWQATKEKTRKAVERIARELLDLYARRKAAQGHTFSAEGAWQAEFERTFEYDETEDQARSIQEVKTDMESPAPMDRLLVGDVGYGKTEVAMRAAFKAVMDGKQVAVLCPTTVLAGQHLQTFRTRMALFPVKVEGLSRLQSKPEQLRVLDGLRKGMIDVVVGTHRLLSDDVGFRDLGLLVVDEEQRFGVKDKERIKRLKTNIDVLTLTATPIPRTLNLSLSGLRDISLIETPPRDRLAVHTVVTPYSPKLIGQAVRTELARGGQVYYIHNRIEDIDKIARLIEQLVPPAKVVTIHGQMKGPELERRMIAFVGRDANVLVSTTIIENGIDIPLVNTLIVDRADLYGLAQLYQLRGRVGRSSRQAYAYFLVPPFGELTDLARRRLKALKEFSELGSGFRLAAKDLEIRGAGNFLGAQQHGFMAAVGFDFYLHLLDQAVRELKGEPVEETKSEIHLHLDIRIPEDYLPQVNLRLNLYKRIAGLETPEEADRLRQEIEDRFGPVPESVDALIRYGVVKLLAQRLRVKSLDRSGDRIVLRFLETSPADVGRMTRLLKLYRGSLTPQGVMTLRLPSPSGALLPLGPAAPGAPRGMTPAAVLHETVRILKELQG